MAQASSPIFGAAAPQDDFPIARSCKKARLGTRVVNHMTGDVAEAFGISDLLAEVLSYLPNQDIASGAIATVTTMRADFHKKFGLDVLRNKFKETREITDREMINFGNHFGQTAKKYTPEKRAEATLKFFPNLEELVLGRGCTIADMYFFPANIRDFCPKFKGLSFEGSYIRPGVITYLNERVPLLSLTYENPSILSADEIDSLAQLSILDVRQFELYDQSKLDTFGKLPHLRELYIIGMLPFIPFNGFASLETLYLTDSLLEDDIDVEFNIDNLASLPKLKTLVLETESGIYTPKALENLQKLQNRIPHVVLADPEGTPLFPALIKLKPPTVEEKEE